MNNLRNRLSGVNGKNKRVKEKEQKIWSEIGMIAGAFALLDVIIRGIMFEFPFKEWAASLVHHYLILLHQGCGIRNAHAENRHQRRTAKTGEAAANRINCGRLCGSGAYDVRQGDSPYILRLAENDSSFYRLWRRSVSASVCDCEAGLQKSGKRRNKKEIILKNRWFLFLFGKRGKRTQSRAVFL
ncbi:hypothetical protein B4071_0312 [Bacillus subtilis]|nr:uncharacterized protein BSBS38_00351 [Bacillus subtilis]KIN40144.1 hypothetical protein B4071_0312 [Bacillus subtilis]MCB4339144.1 hypothetical protein [Bacillus subtilis]PLV39825.1 hypothetical protein BSP2_01610 [Bacillus subtilis subsp. subtilis]